MIVYVSGYNHPQRHGGVKRTAQIRSLLQELDVNEIRLDRERVYARLKSPLFLLKVLAALARNAGNGGSRGFRFATAAACVLLEESLSRLAPVDGAVVEFNPAFTSIAPSVLRDANIPFVLFSHNVEMLVTGKAAMPDFEAYARLEIDAFRSADNCVVISDYDASIVEIFSPRVTCLPYYPVEDDQQSLERIRRARERASRQDRPLVLILGSVFNAPTRQGVEGLLSWVSETPSFFARYDVVVAGYGTENWFSSSDAYRVAGSVTSEELEGLLAECLCVLTYQPPTSGFLTRIVDMNLAGVPLVINHAYRQARPYRGRGVELYGDYADLPAICQRISEASMADELAPPESEKQEVIDLIMSRMAPE